MEQKLLFQDVCDYALWKGFEPRPIEEKSRAKDYTQTYWKCPWDGSTLMALYEGVRRTLRGFEKPEVCWVCIDPYGNIRSIPSRHIRMMGPMCGFGFTDDARNEILKYKNGYAQEDLYYV